MHLVSSHGALDAYVSFAASSRVRSRSRVTHPVQIGAVEDVGVLGRGKVFMVLEFMFCWRVPSCWVVTVNSENRFQSQGGIS